MGGCCSSRERLMRSFGSDNPAPVMFRPTQAEITMNTDGDVNLDGGQFFEALIAHYENLLAHRTMAPEIGGYDIVHTRSVCQAMVIFYQEILGSHTPGGDHILKGRD